MSPIKFTNHARRNFRNLSPAVRKRILNKIKWYATQPDPLRFATPIVNSAGKMYRFRIGQYRVIFDWENNKMLVTEVGHRRDVYS